MENMPNDAYIKLQHEIEAVRNATNNTRLEDLAKEASGMLADGSITIEHFFEVMDKIGALVR